MTARHSIQLVSAATLSDLNVMKELLRQLLAHQPMSFAQSVEAFDQIMTGQVSEAELLDHLGRCRAVCFPAIEEDYGLVTVEAFASRKAVITCTDSGGPTELVRNETNGLVVEPAASSLAVALARVSEDLLLAESFGTAALQQVTAMTWERALDRLLLV